MGTRSLTIVETRKGDEIVVMYRQYDGYPGRHGAELAAYLSDMVIVNGIPHPGDGTHYVNQMAELAALVVHHFKSESMSGGIYLHPAHTRNLAEEYIYTIRQMGDGVWVKVDEVSFDGPNTTLFTGSPQDMKVWIEKLNADN